MSTLTERFYEFMNTIMKFYPTDAVPDKISMPYGTYELRSDSFGGVLSCTVHLYFYTESETIPNRKAEEVCRALDNANVDFEDDLGKRTVWITLDSPEWDKLTDSTDRLLKHRIVNAVLNFL